MIYSCFASTNRGLEELFADELRSLGVFEVEILKSGVKFQATLKLIMQINLQSRLGSRVMIELGHGYYNNEKDIYDIAYNISWHDYFSHESTIKVDTNAIASPLKSIEFINLKVKDALCDKFVAFNNERPNVSKINPDMRIYNFLTANTVTIYLDTSGESLFKRGYREHKLEAPLKENLAAGIIALSNWTVDKTFFDPMCGSGTLAIEAICKGLNIAPGLKRKFAFEKLQIFNKQMWQDIKEDAKSKINYSEKLDVYVSDIDNNAIEALKENCQKIDILKYIKYKRINFLDCDAPNNTGVMVTNPPYGIRLDELETMAHMYPLYARHLKQKFTNWNCYFLTADLRMPKLMRLKPNRKIPLYNGALECRLYEFKMVSGSNR